MRSIRRAAGLPVALSVLALLAAGCGTDQPAEQPEPAPQEGADDLDGEQDAAGEASGPLTVYSGRSEELVGGILADFTEATGIELEVRYGDTAELAATILEEGDASPADIYFGQDAGALGALELEERFAVLPQDLLDLVEPSFRSPAGAWVGITGRARVLAYNTNVLDEGDVPASVFDLTEPEWSGRIGWAPTNGSFQAFVTAMRISEGEDTTRDWLEGMMANEPVVFEKNTGIVEGVARGEVDLGLVNHYYVYRYLDEDPDYNVANHYLPGDIGGLVNVAGVGILDTSDQREAAEEFVRFLLSEETQAYFASGTNAPEFPMRDGIDAPELPSFASLEPPAIDLSRLEDLRGTLELLREVGTLE